MAGSKASNSAAVSACPRFSTSTSACNASEASNGWFINFILRGCSENHRSAAAMAPCQEIGSSALHSSLPVEPTHEIQRDLA
jgi:hypothetical protein